MDFGDILDDWNKRGAAKAAKSAKAGTGAASEAAESGGKGDGGAARSRSPAREPARVDPMTAWLRLHGVQDKDSEAEDESVPDGNAAERRRRAKRMPPDAELDLHGLTREEAWARLEAFFADARRRGLGKVLIVHGKGNHSDGEAVLARMTRDFLEKCPYAGESGKADARSGGSGAVWVLLKSGTDQRSR